MDRIRNTVSRMNLDHLKTFHVVALSGSFTKAAEILYLTQPAVTLQIKGIENALKSELFDRSHRQIRLTPKGKILFKYTRQLFELFDEIEGVFNDFNHLQIGNLTIAASAVIASYYLPKMLATFCSHFPLITVNVKMGDSQTVVDLVANHEADIGLSRHVHKTHGVDMELFSQESYVCVASPNSSYASLKRPLTVAEFAEGYQVMRQPGSRMRTKIEEWFVAEGAESKLLEPKIEVNSLESSKVLIQSGFGIAAFPQIAVREEIKQEKLVEVKVENFNVKADYYISLPTGYSMSPSTFQFHNMLKNHQFRN